MCAAVACLASAQDLLPVSSRVERAALSADTLRLPRWGAGSVRGDTVALALLPVARKLDFIDFKADTLSGTPAALAGILSRLSERHAMGRSLRVVHIGDSHVRGRVFPRTCAGLLEQTFDSLQCADFGINGATCASFSTEERMETIARRRPDVLLVSFGTNEGHDVNLSAARYVAALDAFIAMLREKFPDVPLVFTTPPGAYYKGRPNGHNSLVAHTLVDYCRAHDFLFFDLQRICGGEQACRNWRAARMLRGDGVHFTSDGYRVHGELLYAAIVKSYNKYVSE